MKHQTDFEFEEDKQPLSPPKTSASQYPERPESKFGGPAPDELRPAASASAIGSENEPRKPLEKFEPERLPYNHFFLSVGGYIESGQFSFLDGLSCKYSLVFGRDWQLADVSAVVRISVGNRNGHIAARVQVGLREQQTGCVELPHRGPLPQR